MKIAFIGKGRVATHLCRAFLSVGHNVTMCGGRERQCPVPDDADVVIISIKDDAIASVASEFRNSTALVVHTSGSVHMDAIPCARRGVFYPMQTFSLERNLDYSRIPLFLEAGTDEDMQILTSLAQTISTQCLPMNSERRKTLHLGAVFCCNFVNHLFEQAYNILEKEGIPFSTMLPLIDETIAKIHLLSPREAQTGPAIRWDTTIIDKHMEMLTESRQRELYNLLSKSIRDLHMGQDHSNKHA